ncbi:MAG TPA: amino acid ABC transporter permease [Microbacteriaceae bacterium]|nr:amino acid ABC transporter permease [Microbacteriaceae bacterium]
MESTWGADLSGLVNGLLTALTLTVVGFAAALVLGLLAAACRVSPVRPLRAVGTLYVELFRNIPLLCLLVLIVFGLPDVGVLLPLTIAVVSALAAVNGAFACEAIRSGMNAVPAGAIDAARSLGLGYGATLRLIVFPVALRRSLQPLVNVFISTLLGSSLASAVGVVDLIGAAQIINLREAWGLALFAAAAGVYVAIALGAGALGIVLERRWSRT